jgi:hypothetical protein
MKHLLLCLVVIAALAVAGIGGVLADFSDSEEEMGDLLQAGSLDLTIDGENDPNLVEFELWPMIPEKVIQVTRELKNMGTIDGWLYMHLKNSLHEEANDKDLNGDGIIDSLDMPEPEGVAEQGGIVGGQTVPGLVGILVAMQNYVGVNIEYGPLVGPKQAIDLSSLDTNGDLRVTINELECNQVLLGKLPACGEAYEMTYLFTLYDVPESDYGFNIFDETDPHEVKWEHWPTNAYQGDKVTFDVLYELLQSDYTPPGGG